MNEILFTEEHQTFRQMVAKFVANEIDPNAKKWNEACELPRAVWLKMGELGILGTSYAETYGGSEGDLMYSIILAEELTRSRCSGLNMAVCVHNDMSSNYLLSGPVDLQMKYIPKCITGEAICAIAVTEPGSGSDVGAIKTQAVRQGGQYILNGQKTFITNGYKADLIVVAVKIDPTASRPHHGISLMVVEDDTEGFSRGTKLHKMGNLASDTAELFFQDCPVPAGNLLGEENGGFKIIMEHFGLERLVASAMYVTACEEMLKITTDYCLGPHASGQSNSLSQANKHQLVEMYTETELARTFLYECCCRYMNGERIDKEISMIKYYGSELSNKIANQCMTLHGAYGYMRECPICQWFADVRLYTIGAGTTEIMKEIVAKTIGL